MRTEHLVAGRLRMYSPDAIPLWELSSKRVLVHVGKLFGFEQFQLAQPEDKNLPPGLAFGRGRHPAVEQDVAPTIENLLIGNAQLDLTTRDPEGHSFNDVILRELAKVCDEVTPGQKNWIDGHHVEILQTTWVGQLDLLAEDFLDQRVRNSLVPELARLGGGQGTGRVQPRGLSLRITAREPRQDLLDLGIQLPDVEFRLEPRAGRHASEKAWFSTSNLRSEDHLRLLESLEQAYRA